jgi:hypothetical protein
VFHRELFENLRYFTKPPLVRKNAFVFMLDLIYFVKDQMQSSAIAAVEAAFRSFASVIVVLTHSGE